MLCIVYKIKMLQRCLWLIFLRIQKQENRFLEVKEEVTIEVKWEVKRQFFVVL